MEYKSTYFWYVMFYVEKNKRFNLNVHKIEFKTYDKQILQSLSFHVKFMRFAEVSVS